MAQSPELLAKIEGWRNKQRLGTLTLDEQKEAILVMRADRVSAASQVKTRTASKSKGPVRSADDLLSELGGL